MLKTIIIATFLIAHSALGESICQIIEADKTIRSLDCYPGMGLQTPETAQQMRGQLSQCNDADIETLKNLFENVADLCKAGVKGDALNAAIKAKHGASWENIHNTRLSRRCQDSLQH